MFKNSISKVVFLLTFLFSYPITFAQEAVKDTTKLSYNVYQNEVGIDIKSILRAVPDISIIWKRKIKQSQNCLKNYRFQLYLNGYIPTKNKVTQNDTTNGKFDYESEKFFYIQPMIGIEKIKSYGKFKLFYGIDIGAFYSYRNSGYMYYYQKNSNVANLYNNYYYIYNYTQNPNLFSPNTNYNTNGIWNKYGATIAPFFGVKYFFTDRFSASIETSFYLSYFNMKIKLLPYYSNNNSTAKNIATKIENEGLDFNLKYLRFITFNYHF
ncbi:MAG: hypothetical protein U0V72_13995 [Cytophagales bacterium]